jgi:hypothetical protein
MGDRLFNCRECVWVLVLTGYFDMGVLGPCFRLC